MSQSIDGPGSPSSQPPPQPSSSSPAKPHAALNIKPTGHKAAAESRPLKNVKPSSEAGKMASMRGKLQSKGAPSPSETAQRLAEDATQRSLDLHQKVRLHGPIDAVGGKEVLYALADLAKELAAWAKQPPQDSVDQARFQESVEQCQELLLISDQALPLWGALVKCQRGMDNQDGLPPAFTQRVQERLDKTGDSYEALVHQDAKADAFDQAYQDFAPTLSLVERYGQVTQLDHVPPAAWALLDRELVNWQTAGSAGDSRLESVLAEVHQFAVHDDALRNLSSALENFQVSAEACRPLTYRPATLEADDVHQQNRSLQRLRTLGGDLLAGCRLETKCKDNLDGLAESVSDKQVAVYNQLIERFEVALDQLMQGEKKLGQVNFVEAAALLKPARQAFKALSRDVTALLDKLELPAFSSEQDVRLRSDQEDDGPIPEGVGHLGLEVPAGHRRRQTDQSLPVANHVAQVQAKITEESLQALTQKISNVQEATQAIKDLQDLRAELERAHKAHRPDFKLEFTKGPELLLITEAYQRVLGSWFET